jgi:hypothetical protein
LESRVWLEAAETGERLTADLDHSIKLSEGQQKTCELEFQ